MAKGKKSASGASPKGAEKKSAGGVKGCCTISFDDKKEEEVEGLTEAECKREARRRGGTGQWNKGACA